MTTAITAIKEALAEHAMSEVQRLGQEIEQEPVACKTLCELCVKRGYAFCANAVKTTPIPFPPQRTERHELQAKGEHPAPCARHCEANAFQIVIKNLKAQLAQPEQEPVAVKHMKEWVEYLKRKSDFGQHMKIPSEMSAGACWELAIELEQFINTSPPQRKPLTDEQIESLLMNWPEDGIAFFEFARAIEAAHGIKENT